MSSVASRIWAQQKFGYVPHTSVSGDTWQRLCGGVTSGAGAAFACGAAGPAARSVRSMASTDAMVFSRSGRPVAGTGAAAGIQPIDLGAAASREFLAKANEVGWASVIKRSPENGAKLRQLAGN